MEDLNITAANAENAGETNRCLSPPQRLPLGIPIKLAVIGKIESARGTMGGGKRREPLPYNAFRMAPDLRGRLELGHILTDVYKMVNMVQPVSIFVRPFQKVNQSGKLRCFKIILE